MSAVTLMYQPLRWKCCRHFNKGFKNAGDWCVRRFLRVSGLKHLFQIHFKQILKIEFEYSLIIAYRVSLTTVYFIVVCNEWWQARRESLSSSEHFFVFNGPITPVYRRLYNIIVVLRSVEVRCDLRSSVDFYIFRDLEGSQLSISSLEIESVIIKYSLGMHHLAFHGHDLLLNYRVCFSTCLTTFINR